MTREEPFTIINPEAVGDPDQTPVVQLSPAAAKVIFGLPLKPRPCAACNREKPPPLRVLAEHLAHEDGEVFAALDYARREHYERMAKAALERIG